MSFMTVILSKTKDLLPFFGKMQIPRFARNDSRGDRE